MGKDTVSDFRDWNNDQEASSSLPEWREVFED